MFVEGSTSFLQTALHTKGSSTQTFLLHVSETDANLSKEISKSGVNRISTFSYHIFLFSWLLEEAECVVIYIIVV